MAFAFLKHWLMARPEPRAELRVVLFTRAACGLCEEAHEVLERFRKRYGFVLEVHDVDTRPEWVSDYGDSVPVVMIADRVRFRGRVNEALLKRMLDQ